MKLIKLTQTQTPSQKERKEPPVSIYLNTDTITVIEPSTYVTDYGKTDRERKEAPCTRVNVVGGCYYYVKVTETMEEIADLVNQTPETSIALKKAARNAKELANKIRKAYDEKGRTDCADLALQETERHAQHLKNLAL